MKRNIMLELNFKSLAVACSWTTSINSVANCAQSPASEAVAETFWTPVEVAINFFCLDGFLKWLFTSFFIPAWHLNLTKVKAVNWPCLSAYSSFLSRPFKSLAMIPQ